MFILTLLKASINSTRLRLQEKIIAVEWKNPHTTFHIDAGPISGGIKQVWTVPADEPNALLQKD